MSGSIKYLAVLLLVLACFSLPGEVLHQTTFSLGNGNWKTPPYWNGKTKREKGFFVLESTRRNGREYARAYASLKQVGFFPGYRLRMTVEARGKGRLVGGFLLYDFQDGPPVYQSCPAAELTPEIRKYTYSCELKTMPRMVLPYMDIQGAGRGEIRSVLVENLVEKGVFIRTKDTLQILPVGARPEKVRFQTSRKNSPVTVAWIQGSRAVSRNLKSDSSGFLTVQPESGKEGDAQTVATVKGVSARIFLDFMEQGAYEKFDAVARKVRTASPVHVLFIGDSLTDFYRGRNYADKLFFWLNKYNSGKFTFHNAGVGGDLLPRVKTRLLGMTGGRKTYRQETETCSSFYRKILLQFRKSQTEINFC